MTQKIMDKIYELQERYDKYLPESIRDDAFAIEHAIEHPHMLNDAERLAGEVVLWTVEMFEAYEEGELE